VEGAGFNLNGASLKGRDQKRGRKGWAERGQSVSSGIEGGRIESQVNRDGGTSRGGSARTLRTALQGEAFLMRKEGDEC